MSGGGMMGGGGNASYGGGYSGNNASYNGNMNAGFGPDVNNFGGGYGPGPAYTPNPYQTNPYMGVGGRPNYNTGAIAPGSTAGQAMGQNFNNQDFVQNLYGTIEGRSSVGTQPGQIDQSGLNYWTNALNRGANRNEVQKSFQEAASANPGVANRIQNQALSQISGARPSSQSPQYYQPVYQGQYTNYANPGYDMMGQVNNTFGGYGNQFSPYGGQFSPYGNSYNSPFGGGFGGGYSGGYGDISNIASLLNRFFSQQSQPTSTTPGQTTQATQTTPAIPVADTSTPAPVVNEPAPTPAAPTPAAPTPTNRDAISNYYTKYLGRAADTGGLDYWNNAATGGMSLADIENNIKGSQEYQNRNAISGMYDKYLGRAADTEGLSYWQDRANNGMSLDAIQQSIMGAANNPASGTAGSTGTVTVARGGRIQNNGIAGIRRK